MGRDRRIVFRTPGTGRNWEDMGAHILKQLFVTICTFQTGSAVQLRQESFFQETTFTVPLNLKLLMYLQQNSLIFEFRYLNLLTPIKVIQPSMEIDNKVVKSPGQPDGGVWYVPHSFNVGEPVSLMYLMWTTVQTENFNTSDRSNFHKSWQFKLTQ